MENSPHYDDMKGRYYYGNNNEEKPVFERE